MRRIKGGAFFRTKIRARGSVILDYDNDGRIDILVTTMGDRPFLAAQPRARPNHWLTLDLQGTKSNRDGFGARITLAGRKQNPDTPKPAVPAAFLGQSDRRVHFGLGPSENVEKLEIRWPSGTVQTLENVAADQILKIKEP